MDTMNETDIVKYIHYSVEEDCIFLIEVSRGFLILINRSISLVVPFLIIFSSQVECSLRMKLVLLFCGC